MEHSTTNNNGSSTQDDRREIRIGLVLYGGVSLAVYENGVTKAFYDLVKGNGIFELLLGLLDATAVVDVIAGTSAGGINGLLLATALSSGSAFDETANLWREHGDLGSLMRSASKADQAESLLDGEGYYHDKLQSAFKMLLEQGDPGKESTGEIDVFITGTDLPGHVKTTWDQLGSRIADKNHRVVFQLKYRPGRRKLGLGSEATQKAETNGTPSPGNTPQQGVEQQSAILASIARITSTFPAAFPPFRLSQLDERVRDDVRQALENCGGLTEYRNLSHTYVDGGVLDNKPFGPLLRAIFYRVPYGVVDRRLFYLEPDPEHISRLNEEKRQITPVGTIISCMSSIPSYQSIGEDLERLREHNARVRWLGGLKKAMTEGIEKDPGACVNAAGSSGNAAYCRTRIDSLARTLLLEVDAMPSAADTLAGPAQERLYTDLMVTLSKIGEQDDGMAWITSYDIDYHMRQAFHVLYAMYADLEKGADAKATTRTAMKATSRIVKLLKLIRDMLFLLRDRTVPACVASGSATPQTIFDLFMPFLAEEAAHWSPVMAQLHHDFSVEQLALRDQGPLSSPLLSQTVQAAHAAVEKLAGSGARKPDPSEETAPEAAAGVETGKQPVTILDAVEGLLRKIVAAWQGNNTCLTTFQALDQVFFPLEFASGIHELDEIELVRISPRDAQTGLSFLEPHKKVTGDELAHFAAFFRRDWRSNDILWGRLDGICQIVNALLNTEALKRLRKRQDLLSPLLDQATIRSALADCPEPVCRELEEAARNLAAALDSHPEGLAQAFDTLKTKLILAGQYQAVHKDFKGVYEDLFFQENSWESGNRQGQRCMGALGSPEALSAAAKKTTEELFQSMQGEDLGKAFKKLEIGAQTVTGKNGRVPLKILSEYISQAYLLVWGMLETTLGGRQAAKNLLARGRLRLFLRSPILFIHTSLRMMRTDKHLASVGLGVLCAALLASGATGIFLGNFWFLIPFLLPFALFALYNAFSRFRSKPSA